MMKCCLTYALYSSRILFLFVLVSECLTDRKTDCTMPECVGVMQSIMK